MKTAKKVEAHLEEYIMGALLIGISFILMLQIVMRMLKLSLAWPEELARYFYIWSVLLSLGYTVRSNSILRVDLLLEMLPGPVKRVMETLLQGISSVFYAFLFYYSLSVVSNIKISGQTTPALEWPMYVIYLIIPVGFFLASLRSLQKIYWNATGRLPEFTPGNIE